MDRWHQRQSDAVLRINEWAMLNGLERFWHEGGRSLIGLVFCEMFLPIDVYLS